MPIKLIGTVILVVIVGIFCGFNTADANKCDINLVFRTLHGIPVFLTVLLSFLGGVIVMAPFTVRFGSGKQEKKEKPQNDSPTAFPQTQNTEKPQTIIVNGEEVSLNDGTPI